MPNEITIVIKARGETAGEFEKLKVDSGKAGAEAGLAYREGFKQGAGHLEEEIDSKQVGAKSGDAIGGQIKEHVSEKIAEVGNDPKITTSGRDIGDKLGASVSEGIGRELERGLTDELQKRFNNFASGKFEAKVSPKIDKTSFTNDIKSAISGKSGGIGQAMQQAMGGTGSALTSFPWMGAAIAGAIVLGAPLIGGALSSAADFTVVGAPLAAGIVAAFESPAIRKEVSNFKKQIGDIFRTDFVGNNFAPAVASFFGTQGKGADGLLQIIKQLRPELKELGAELAPAANLLSQGLVGFIKEALPGILAASKAAIPVLDLFSKDLPSIGDAIGRFFKIISSNSGDTAIFWDDFIGGLTLAIVQIAHLIVGLTEFYLAAKHAALNALLYFAMMYDSIAHGAVVAFGWIPGLGPKVKKAAADADKYLQGVVTTLAEIKSREITIRINTVFAGVGGAAVGIAALLRGKASGGITGSANGATPSGLTWVGENGPELMSAPPGSRVYSHGDSNRLAAGGGSGAPIVVQIMLSGQQVAAAVIDPIRRTVRHDYGGNVQIALGS